MRLNYRHKNEELLQLQTLHIQREHVFNPKSNQLVCTMKPIVKSMHSIVSTCYRLAIFT
jgi:hypothetical protein